MSAATHDFKIQGKGRAHENETRDAISQALDFIEKRARNDYTNLKSYCLKRTQNTLASPQFATRSLQL